MALVDFLEDNGITVHEAASGDDAWDMIERGTGYDVVYTDVNMPGGIDGLDLAQKVARRGGQTRIVILSGRQHPGRDALPPGAVFLVKPYRYEELLALAAA